MAEKVVIMPSMRGLGKGEKISFPVNLVSLVRNNVTILNTVHFNEGKVWKSKTSKEDGVIIVERVE